MRLSSPVGCIHPTTFFCNVWVDALPTSRRAAKLAEDIREMKQLKTRLSAAVRATIETHLGLLEGLAADPPDDPVLEGKIAYLTRTPREARGGRDT